MFLHVGPRFVFIMHRHVGDVIHILADGSRYSADWQLLVVKET